MRVGMTGYSTEWRRLVAEAIANGACCADCGTRQNLEGDHELPLSKGGLSTRANLAIRCRRCNRHKSNRVTRYQMRIPWPYTPPGALSQQGPSTGAPRSIAPTHTPTTTTRDSGRTSTNTYEGKSQRFSREEGARDRAGRMPDLEPTPSPEAVR